LTAMVKTLHCLALLCLQLEDYQEELEEMKNMTRQEYVAHLRRKSSGFSRGASMYRGVTRHHQHGRWQARIGRVSGNKDLYLGTFSMKCSSILLFIPSCCSIIDLCIFCISIHSSTASYSSLTVLLFAGTQEEAAEAYDIAAIKFRGLNAVTNFDITRYDVDKIMASNTLLPGELARRKKDDEVVQAVADGGGGVTAAALVQQAANANAAAAETWKVAAAALAAAPRVAVEHGHGGAHHHHHHHHDVMSGAEAFSVLHDLVVTAADGGHHGAAGGGASQHMPMSSASSLVTSLGNSREGSPDRGGGLSMLFSKPPPSAPAQQQATNKPMSPLMPLGSWASPASARAAAAVSIAHMPVFAAWTDA
ncbi:AP2-like ethylene-responsive transcription factor ANT, partial [Dichanthelium oligosanthes]